MSVKTKFRLGFAVIAGRTIGMGHLSRCVNFATALIKRHGLAYSDICFVFGKTEDTELLSQFLDNAGLSQTQRIFTEYPTGLKRKFDVLVVDRLQNTLSNIEHWKSLTNKLVVFDDENVAHGLADLCINSLYPPKNQKINGHEARVLIGPQYHFPRNEILESRKTNFSNSMKKIAILQGGSDPNCCSMMIAETIQKALAPTRESVEIIIISGPLNNCPYNEKLQCPDQSSQVSLVRSPQNLAQILISCDIVVSAVGITALDLIHLRVPSIFITSISKESVTGDLLEALQITKYFGLVSPSTLCDLGQFLKTLDISTFNENYIERCDLLFDDHEPHELLDQVFSLFGG